MKKLWIICFTLFSLAAWGQSYKIAIQASTLTWTGHAQTSVYSPKGTLAIKSGMVIYINNKLTGGTVIVDMTTLKTDNGEMQEHLRGKDFFDVGKFPEAVLQLATVSGSTGKGTLTIKGIRQPVILQLTTAQGKIHATGTIDRTLYGIKYNSASYFQDLGSYAIRNTFEIDVTLVTL